ncbi:flagellar hook capping FlgD N-terminal domain-containing protein [Sphingomonas sp. 2R-10]|uniref:flagellar hook assembly protein FlgD n=1 Tax=Sphingomonas sp. 2R-10 TaxID=3045148 RepID=UPI000F793830|nr:flagellar hook capping FlgD N-terminal domain-containing protein [Sphingomonas sp. 2R-10]MDJ0276550.1 flagellar hook capping FlgD N-terminal domain-containing protein [Sphingomonas sp. 2R-10]
MATTSVQNIPTVKGASDAAAKAKLGQRSLGQEDFLRLMTAQLQYQDPFNPTDNTQMVAQMAQMSSLSGITEMTSTLKTLAARMSDSGTSDAVSWIGKAVLTESATATADTKGNVTGAVELDAEAAQVKVEIRDAAGNVARAVSLGGQPKGLVDYQWDGKTNDGSAAGAGPYTISVAATDKNGQVVKARNLTWTGVSSVMPNGGKPMLTLSSGEQVLADSVRKIA